MNTRTTHITATDDTQHSSPPHPSHAPLLVGTTAVGVAAQQRSLDLGRAVEYHGEILGGENIKNRPGRT